MRERVVMFGDERSQVGIVTTPDAGQNGARMPLVLFWNAGMLHRVGPYRLYVTLAREAAKRGFHAFRFDLPGRGDSEMTGGKEHSEDRNADDVGAAMQYLQDHMGARTFILVGLCSGADDAYAVAVKDARVVGVIGLDGLAYPSFRSRTRHVVRHYGSRVVNPPFLWRKLRENRKRETNIDTLRRFPSLGEARRGMNLLFGRNVRVLLIYAGDNAVVNYRGQLAETLGIQGYDKLLCVKYLREADHVYTIPQDRWELTSIILQWLELSWPDVVSGGAQRNRVEARSRVVAR